MRGRVTCRLGDGSNRKTKKEKKRRMREAPVQPRSTPLSLDVAEPADLHLTASWRSRQVQAQMHYG